MLRSSLAIACLAASAALNAQYGTFDAAVAKAAKALPLTVVLDAGDSPYNRAIIDAVKAEWKLSAATDFITVSDLAMQPIGPDKAYLLKTRRTDPVKFEGTFLSLIKGWKRKKGEPLQQADNAFTTIPAEQEMASLLIDPKAINDQGMVGMLTVYVKHLQDYLKNVEAGRITDKTTADRLYASRTRLIRESELIIAKEHLDKSVADEAAIKTEYAAPFKLGGRAEVAGAVEAQDRSKAVTDVVITVGDHKNKHCFKRVFNAGTGELMYLRDDQALFGKKEGFIAEDLKSLARAR
ncbi:MAG: hypothetical protein ACK4L7_00175 [Flavobacteriales bacterium]